MLPRLAALPHSPERWSAGSYSYARDSGRCPADFVRGLPPLSLSVICSRAPSREIFDSVLSDSDGALASLLRATCPRAESRSWWYTVLHPSYGRSGRKSRTVEEDQQGLGEQAGRAGSG